MRLRLRLDGRAPRRWHVTLIERLMRLPDVALDLDASPGPGGLPDNADLLFRLEALIRRQPRDGPSALVPQETLRAYPSHGPAPDLVLDLCGDVPAGASAPVWTLRFDTIPGEEGLLASLLDGRVPVVTLGEAGRVLASARLGTESIGSVLVSFEDAVARTTSLLVAAVAGRRPLLSPADADPPDPPPKANLTLPRVGLRTTTMLAWGVLRRIYHLCYRAPHWRVGWRHLDGPDTVDLRALPDPAGTTCPTTAAASTPILSPWIMKAARSCSWRITSMPAARPSSRRWPSTPNGPVGTPVPVLEEPYHLSYPFVFAREGAVWMVPESSINGTVDLYRATAFPGGWVKEATLLSGLTAGDVTLLEQGGRWWMFATVRDVHADNGSGPIRGSYSDALYLWSALDFRGPWTPHAR